MHLHKASCFLKVATCGSMVFAVFWICKRTVKSLPNKAKSTDFSGLNERKKVVGSIYIYNHLISSIYRLCTMVYIAFVWGYIPTTSYVRTWIIPMTLGHRWPINQTTPAPTWRSACKAPSRRLQRWKRRQKLKVRTFWKTTCRWILPPHPKQDNKWQTWWFIYKDSLLIMVMFRKKMTGILGEGVRFTFQKGSSFWSVGKRAFTPF